jgi:catechol 2,3-dioxygenase-like lactoylglutathione lyase family enzyme
MRSILPLAAIFAALPVTALCQNKEPYIDPGMNKIVQVAIVCKDIEACSQRWARMLGQKVNPIRTTVPGREAKVLYRGKPSDGRLKLTFFNTGTAVLELMQPVGGDTAWKEYLDRNGEGVQHIAFQVVDLEKTIQSLEQQGMPVIHRGRYDSNDGDYVYMDSQDKLGVTVELLHSDKK